MNPLGDQPEPPRYDAEVRRQRMAFLEFGERDQQLLAALGEALEPHLNEVVERFYDYLTGFPETRSVFRTPETVQRLKSAQRAYLRQALRGPYDETYFRARWRIGHVHNTIHLEPFWFIGGVQLYHRILFPLVQELCGGDQDTLMAQLMALDKVMTLDMTIALDSYWRQYSATMERLVELNRHLQAASIAQHRFLGNVSHEFRTPLNTILGFADALREGMAGSLNDTQLDYLGEIGRAGEMLLRLIDATLELAREETAEKAPSTAVEVAPALREIAEALRDSAERKGLRLQVQVPDDAGWIEVDEYRFREAVAELLINAFKFTESGVVTLSAEVEDDHTGIIVSDTGIGIKPEDQQRIFEDFVQVDSSHAAPQAGIGIGLTLVRRVAEAHGGRVWVESRLGEGSRFHLCLPRRPARA